MDNVETLLEQISANPEDAKDESKAAALLKEFHRGTPLQYLQPLLLSPDHRLARLGAWIASELGVQGKPLLSVVADLLRHPDKSVRFWIIDCILLWAGPSEGREISHVVRLIDDPERAVRWKAMVFLFRASREQLESALAFLDAKQPGSPNGAGLRWLLGAAGRNPEAVEAELRSPEGRMRNYAAAAAARMSAENRHPLLVAATSSDRDVAEFAADRL